MYRKPDPPRMIDGMLRWQGAVLADLARDLPTPFFLFSAVRLVENLEAVRSGLETAGVPAHVRYCAKTNSELGIQEIFAAAGSEVLASTVEEVKLALAAGFRPETIAYQRPVLGAEFAEVIAMGVRLVHAYRISDLDTLERFAAESGVTLSVSLRIRDDRGGILLLRAAAQRLGFSPGEAVEAARRMQSLPHLSLAALNSYVGTQQPGLARFSSSIRVLGATAEAIRKASRQEVAELNIGGGIPSDTLRRISPRHIFHRAVDRAGEPAMSLAEFSSGVGDILRREIERVPFIQRVAAEPGRSLVGNAGILVTRVTDVQGNWLFLDASRNFLCESPLLFNRRIDVQSRDGSSGDDRFYHLSGCTLNTLDVIDWRRRLPQVDRGDLLVISDAGAYSLARAARYAGLSPAAYIINGENTIRPIRRAENLADLTAPMIGREGLDKAPF